MKAARLVQSVFSRLGLLLLKKDHPAARYVSLRPDTGLSYALHRSGLHRSPVRFIQIGANDGQRYDPIAQHIRDRGWSGTLIEPRGLYFRALKQRYADHPRIRLVQAALAADRSERTLYYIESNESVLPDWVHGLATLERQRIENACRELGLPPESIHGETVPCIRWKDLEPATRLDETDLLVLDAEGYDIPLLNLWDWEHHRPRIVHFEHACGPEKDYFELLSKLRALGYESVADACDTTLYLPAESTNNL